MLKLSEVYDWFFNLDFVRSQYPMLKEKSDTAIIRDILDPDNTSPYDPNLLFDGSFYKRNLGSGTSLRNPVLHFLTEGANQGLSSNLCFDPLYYLTQVPGPPMSVMAALKDALSRLDGKGTLPAFHPFINEEYIRLQHNPGEPSDFYLRLFRGNYFISKSAPLVDIAYFGHSVQKEFDSFAEAFGHYWQAEEDLSTHVLFELDYYRSQLPDEERVRRAVYHYLVSDHPLSPQPLFDPGFYLASTRKLLGESPRRPFEHFLTKGQAAGLTPSPLFDVDFYRRQTHCGPDALQHYLEGGHRSTEAHPMVRFAEARLLSNAALDPNRSTLSRLAESSPELPLSVTPEFDPSYWKPKSGKALPADASEIELRDHYLKQGYPAGLCPNWLLSASYIAKQAELEDKKNVNSIQHYFSQGWHRRVGVMIALHSFQDTPGNRTWLEILRGQVDVTDLEVIVVAQSPGPLSKEFRDCAHVWQVPKPTENKSHSEQLEISITRLNETLQANPPAVVFVEGESDWLLAMNLKVFDAPKVLFGGPKLLQAEHEDVEQINTAANLVWSLAGPVSDHLKRLFDTSNIQVREGYYPGANARAITRSRLGVGSDAILVVGSGPLDIANGVDLFGAIAARYYTASGTKPDLCFAWQGSGPTHPNTPAFYARYAVDIAAGPGKLHILTDIDTRSVLAAADIFLQTRRHHSDFDASDDARAMGVPVLRMSDTLDSDTQTFAPYDLDDAVSALAFLVENLKPPSIFRTGALADTSNNSDLSKFVRSFNECTQSLGVDVKFVEPASTTQCQNLLVLTSEKRLIKIREFEPTKRYFGLPDSVRISQAQLEHMDLPDGFKNLLVQESESDLVFCAVETADLSGLADRFNRLIGLLEAGDLDLDVAGKMSAVCDRIAVDSPELSTAMEAINPRKAAALTYTNGDIPCSEAC